MKNIPLSIPRLALLLLALNFILAPGRAAFAQTSALGSASPTVYHWHSIVLQHALPEDILKLMHWNNAFSPDFNPLSPSPNLPAGVDRVFALPSNNTLVVHATDEGYSQIQQIVRPLDIAPPQVEFKTLFVAIPTARADLLDLKTNAALLLPQMLNGASRLALPPPVTATNGIQASIECTLPPASTSVHTYLVSPRFFRHNQGSWLMSPCQVWLTPNINADHTITLSLTPAPSEPDPALLTSQQNNTTIRTLQDGMMTVYDVTGLTETPGERLFLFLTPRIVTDSNTPNANGGQSVVMP